MHRLYGVDALLLLCIPPKRGMPPVRSGARWFTLMHSVALSSARVQMPSSALVASSEVRAHLRRGKGGVARYQ